MVDRTKWLILELEVITILLRVVGQKSREDVLYAQNKSKYRIGTQPHCTGRITRIYQ